jgi:hypothetical protein
VDVAVRVEVHHSTLVGAALKDGYIKSLDDPVTRYIAGLRGSADSVTVRPPSR